MTIEVDKRIGAPCDRVYALISDPIEMARWNPAFDHVHWLHGASEPAVDAQFQVHNVDARFDWSLDDCVVIEHEPPRVFAFARVVGTHEAAVQRYVLEPDGEDTLVTVTYELRWQPFHERIRSLFQDREGDVRRALQAALEGLDRDLLA